MYVPPRRGRRRRGGGDGGGGGGNQRVPNPNPNPPLPYRQLYNPYLQQQEQRQWRSFENTSGGSQSMVSPERIEAAVMKAKQDLLLAGKYVSSLKVAQAAAVALQVDFGSSMWFRIQDVDFLKDLMLIEGKVGAFIHCFVSARKVTSVHELSVEICESEGVEQFEELGLGPLLRHPLIEHYFSVPEDVTEVAKIGSEEIIGWLDKYHYRCKGKDVVVEEFIDFIAKKHEIDAREKLGVRIRSLGLLIKYILKGRRTESSSLKKARAIARENLNKQIPEEESSQDPTMPLQNEDAVSPFPFNEMDDIDDEIGLSSLSHSLSGTVRVVNHSINEEMRLLWKKPAMVIKKGQYEKKIIAISQAMKISRKNAKKLLRESGTFIIRWKEACQKHSTQNIIAMMMQFYHFSVAKRHPSQKNQNLLSLFSKNPVAGLLKVFVIFANIGMLDRFCESLELTDPVECESVNLSLDNCINTAFGGTATSLDPKSKNNESRHESRQCATVDDIIKKIEVYFEINPIKATERDTSLEKQLVLFKKFSDCKTWLAMEFSVEKFSYLGYGDFFEFLQQNASVLPSEIHGCFAGEIRQNLTTDIAIIKNQLHVFLSQAENNIINNGPINKYYISLLLKRQFPTITFQIMGNETDAHFSNLIQRQKGSGAFSCVFFSAALLGEQFTRKTLPNNNKTFSENCGMVIEANRHSDSIENSSAKDAIKCLLKTPMLSDLQSWSHWDILFAPSFGPLLDWLLNDGYIKELSCIVTRDGKLIRIDHSATADEFLDASINGSSFHAAVKLLSILTLYGGTRSFPLSLIKCYAQRAIGIMIRNSIDSMLSSRKTETRPLHRNTFHGSEMKESNFVAVSLASKFILDCLGYLPSEFWCYGADILVSGLRSCTKNAPLAILHECRHGQDRHMLHHIGLSLGIVEWVDDYHSFCSAATVDLPCCSPSNGNSASDMDGLPRLPSEILLSSNIEMLPSAGADSSILDLHPESSDESKHTKDHKETSELNVSEEKSSFISQDIAVQEAVHIIETIRREEFGIESNLKYDERNFLSKQHARLGRALHCLSEELYSQDSHLILELVQNADDNTYPENVEPTIVFILQATGIVLLNNEKGFSAQNIRALCDIGSSTKTGSTVGYIGKKGIGFKSVFRVTEAPEIHSNGFHVKFDTKEGPIGFILPTVIPPYNAEELKKLLSSEDDQTDTKLWKTCIVLPFRSDLRERIGINSIISMFSDLHPSLLLFLHRIQCIKFKNILNDTLVIMRKETLEDGIVKVSLGSEKLSCLVVRQKLLASAVRSDRQTTEIAVAFTFQESENGEYKPYLFQQPVFAFLPLRAYGLKFILQGDFVLPSSREEVDANSAWNQWLLSEFPSFIVNAERSFCYIECFKENPGKAVTAFMSFVPLVGEVYGFFSHLPRMIIKRLRESDCLILEGHNTVWVPPHKVLRGWNDEMRTLIPDNLLQQHLGLGYLNQDITIPDALSKALGVTEYGPRVLMDIILSICHDNEDIKLLGLSWVSSWLSAFWATLSIHVSRNFISDDGLEHDHFKSLRKVSFIPLSDKSYSSLDAGPIWFPCDFSSVGFEGRYISKDFPCLYSKLRIVNPLLFSIESLHANTMEEERVHNIIQLLCRIGVQRLSAHEMIKTHILPAFSENKHIKEDSNLAIEYLSFIMLHFLNSCPSCYIEKVGMLEELNKMSVILTNHGYKCPKEEPIHFSKEFGNVMNIKKLIDDEDKIWNEVDMIYLEHPNAKSYPSRKKKWREFFQELGVTDFVQLVCVEKNVVDVFVVTSEMATYNGKHDTADLLVTDWESPELAYILHTISSKKLPGRCKYLMEVLDKMWDDYFSTKAYIINNHDNNISLTESSFLKSIQNIRWVVSSKDEEFHYPRDIFYDCESVRSVLGSYTNYAIPQVSSKKFMKDLGLKTRVEFDDAFLFLRSWQMHEVSFKASISQMTELYKIISDEVGKSNGKITGELKSSPMIFVPSSTASFNNAVSGVFLSPSDVFWNDPTGCIDQAKKVLFCASSKDSFALPCRALAGIYPSLHDFFVYDCDVHEKPHLGSYMQTLLQLSSGASPSQAAYAVFMIFWKLASDLKVGIMKPEEIFNLKESLTKLETKVLPTTQNKWVSLHPSFGLVCWCDDEELIEQFEHVDDAQFLQFGELDNEEKEILNGKLAVLLRKLGVPSLSEVVTREAIFYGSGDNLEKASLLNWVLPYAQRYLLKFHPDLYLHLKEVGPEKCSQLQVVVVEKLFYKYTFKGCHGTSNKRFVCSSLLQGNILYLNQASDSHSIFLEFSKVFFDGTADLHLANFLHMITTKVESACSEEEIELFMENNQKLSRLPVGEPVWSLVLSPLNEMKASEQACLVSMSSKQNLFMYSRKSGSRSHWPPTDHSTALGYEFSLGDPSRKGEAPEAKGFIHSGDILVSVEVDGDWTEEVVSEKTMAPVLLNLCTFEEPSHSVEPSNSFEFLSSSTLECNTDLEKSDTIVDPDGNANSLEHYQEMSKYLLAGDGIQSLKTGRLGERIAHKYFSEKLASVTVKWVNEETETGLPFDLLLVHQDKNTEYIEVKATTDASKGCLQITTREWQFAVEKGDSFSIAHVALDSSKKAKITIVKNPFKLCQQGRLHLFILMPQQPWNSPEVPFGSDY